MAEKPIYTFPPIVEETLANGLHLMLVEDHEQEGITLALQMPFGEFCDPVSREGAAEMAIGVMLKGPASLSPEEFSEKLEHSGASLFTDVGDEHCILGGKMLARSSEQIIPLFWEMVCNPGFRPKELARIKRETITGLQAELADPASIANKHFGCVLCGPDHPIAEYKPSGRSRESASTTSKNCAIPIFRPCTRFLFSPVIFAFTKCFQNGEGCLNRGRKDPVAIP